MPLMAKGFAYDPLYGVARDRIGRKALGNNKAKPRLVGLLR